jgi:hypothetical protein
MKKLIKLVDEKRGVLQVTTLDERWYAIQSEDKSTGLPVYDYLPSVTWIGDYYPKGIAYFKWLADKGWDEAEAIKVAAGDKGSKVHLATEDIEDGLEIPIDAKYYNRSLEQDEELTLEEVNCVQSFCEWLDETKPELIAKEITVINKEHRYAGTVDRIYRINGVIWIVDLKTSNYIWPSHELQLSAYSHADINIEDLEGVTQEEWDNRKLGVLQLGYRRNKKRYKFTEIQDKFGLFLNAQQIWANENPDAKPKQRDYPLVLKAKVRQEVKK